MKRPQSYASARDGEISVESRSALKAGGGSEVAGVGVDGATRGNIALTALERPGVNVERSDGDGLRLVGSSRVRTGTPASLIPRERQVLDALCEGLSYKQIAFDLQISESTVKWYLASAREKLAATNAANAAAIWTAMKFKRAA